MKTKGIRIVLALPEFFSTNPKKLAVEENQFAGRTYFLKGNRIVAVAETQEAK